MKASRRRVRGGVWLMYCCQTCRTMSFGGLLGVNVMAVVLPVALDEVAEEGAAVTAVVELWGAAAARLGAIV